jgi:hypothetical protein
LTSASHLSAPGLSGNCSGGVAEMGKLVNEGGAGADGVAGLSNGENGAFCAGTDWTATGGGATARDCATPGGFTPGMADGASSER